MTGGWSHTRGSLLPGGCPTRSWNAPTPACVTQPLSEFSPVGSKWSSTTLLRALHIHLNRQSCEQPLRVDAVDKFSLKPSLLDSNLEGWQLPGLALTVTSEPVHKFLHSTQHPTLDAQIKPLPVHSHAVTSEAMGHVALFT